MKNYSAYVALALVGGLSRLQSYNGLVAGQVFFILFYFIATLLKENRDVIPSLFIIQLFFKPTLCYPRRYSRCVRAAKVLNIQNWYPLSNRLGRVVGKERDFLYQFFQ